MPPKGLRTPGPRIAKPLVRSPINLRRRSKSEPRPTSKQLVHCHITERTIRNPSEEGSLTKRGRPVKRLGLGPTQVNQTDRPTQVDKEPAETKAARKLIVAAEVHSRPSTPVITEEIKEEEPSSPEQTSTPIKAVGEINIRAPPPTPAEELPTLTTQDLSLHLTQSDDEDKENRTPIGSDDLNTEFDPDQFEEVISTLPEETLIEQPNQLRISQIDQTQESDQIVPGEETESDQSRNTDNSGTRLTDAQRVDSSLESEDRGLEDPREVFERYQDIFSRVKGTQEEINRLKVEKVKLQLEQALRESKKEFEEEARKEYLTYQKGVIEKFRLKLRDSEEHYNKVLEQQEVEHQEALATIRENSAAELKKLQEQEKAKVKIAEENRLQEEEVERAKRVEQEALHLKLEEYKKEVDAELKQRKRALRDHFVEVLEGYKKELTATQNERKAEVKAEIIKELQGDYNEFCLQQEKSLKIRKQEIRDKNLKELEKVETEERLKLERKIETTRRELSRQASRELEVQTAEELRRIREANALLEHSLEHLWPRKPGDEKEELRTFPTVPEYTRALSLQSIDDDSARYVQEIEVWLDARRNRGLPALPFPPATTKEIVSINDPEPRVHWESPVALEIPRENSPEITETAYKITSYSEFELKEQSSCEPDEDPQEGGETDFEGEGDSENEVISPTPTSQGEKEFTLAFKGSPDQEVSAGNIGEDDSLEFFMMSERGQNRFLERVRNLLKEGREEEQDRQKQGTDTIRKELAAIRTSTDSNQETLGQRLTDLGRDLDKMKIAMGQGKQRETVSEIKNALTEMKKLKESLDKEDDVRVGSTLRVFSIERKDQSVEDFVEKFKDLAEAKRWDPYKRIINLKLYTEGAIRTWLQTKLDEMDYSRKKLAGQIDENFVDSVLQKMITEYSPRSEYFVQLGLEVPFQGQEEGVREFYSRVIQWNKNRDASPKEVTAMFIKGLSPDLRNYVLAQEGPNAEMHNLDKHYQLAKFAEGIKKATKTHPGVMAYGVDTMIGMIEPGPVRRTELNTGYVQEDDESNNDKFEAISDVIVQLAERDKERTEQLKKLLNKEEERQQQRRRQFEPNRPLVCNYCNNNGHIARFCPKRVADMMQRMNAMENQQFALPPPTQNVQFQGQNPQYMGQNLQNSQYSGQGPQYPDQNPQFQGQGPYQNQQPQGQNPNYFQVGRGGGRGRFGGRRGGYRGNGDHNQSQNQSGQGQEPQENASSGSDNKYRQQGGQQQRLN